MSLQAPAMAATQISIPLPAKHPVPHKCVHCQKLILDGWEGEQKLDFTLSDMIQWAMDGCTFFEYVCSNFVDSRAEESGAGITENKKEYQGIFPTCLAMDIGADLAYEFCADYDEEQQWWFLTSEKPLLAVFPDTPVGSTASTNLVNIEVGSESSFDSAASWLRTCLTSHEKCRESRTHFLPHRLLEISGQGQETQLRLLNTECVKPEPYAALSYCWGGDQDYKSRKATVQQYLHGIDFQRLPKSLKDAILITSKLGIRYLWIDALCLVQDDPVDISLGLSQMTEVYGQATITIAASRAKSVHEGFLHDRVDIYNPNSIFEIPCRTKNNQSRSFVLVGCWVPQNPLHKRAWAVQEHLLSPRVLEYAIEQTRWSCLSAEHRDGWRSEGLYSTKEIARARQLLASNDSGTHDIHKEKFHHELWEVLVSVYSLGQLTCQDDKLPALAAAAQKFNAHFGDEYLAGLWRSTLPQGLLWIAGPQAAQTTAPRYQAPSWSWASLASPVEFSDVRKELRAFYYLELIDCCVKLRDERMPYGAIESGYLEVSGRKLVASTTAYLKLSEDGRYEMFKGFFDLEEIKREYHCFIYLDASDESFCNNATISPLVEFLEVAAGLDKSRVCIEGLVLRESHNRTQCYRRIGYFKVTLYGVQDAMKGNECNEGESEEHYHERVLKVMDLFQKCKAEKIMII